MLVTDNLGELPSKTKKFINILSVVLCAISIGLWFIPEALTENLLRGLPRFVSVYLLTSVASVYFRMILLKKFSKKYGKFKPWLLFAGAPIAVLLSSITFFPYQSMTICLTINGCSEP